MSEAYNELQAAADELGLTLEFQFQPQIFFDGTPPEKMNMKWLATIMHKSKAVLATLYTQGVAHCPSYPRGKFGRLTVSEYDNLRRDCANPPRKGAPRQPLDALWCIATDCQSVMNCGSFEEWAGEFGYDTDSRQAEKTYNECVSNYMALKRAIGDDGIERLAAVEL